MDIQTLLTKLVSINSIYPHEHELQTFLVSYLHDHGFDSTEHAIDAAYHTAENDATRKNIFATKGPAGASQAILFYAHMDTVPVHDADQRVSDPFTLTEDGDDVWRGLGSVDMKGGMTAILDAVSQIDEELLRKKDLQIKVLLGVDEEYRSKGAHSAVLQDDFFSNVSAMLVPEVGSQSALEDGPRDIQKIVLGRRGRMLVNVEVTGKSAHAAVAGTGKGINAITEMSKLLVGLEGYEVRDQVGNLPAGNQLVRSCESYVSSLSVPEKANFVLDIHTIVGETHETVIASIDTQIDSIFEKGEMNIHRDAVVVTAGTRPTPAPEAYEIAVDNMFVKKVIDAAESVCAGGTQIAYGYSVADENVFQKHFPHIPIIIMGPDGDKEHSANEWVSLESIGRLSKIYQEVITNRF